MKQQKPEIRDISLVQVRGKGKGRGSVGRMKEDGDIIYS